MALTNNRLQNISTIKQHCINLSHSESLDHIGFWESEVRYAGLNAYLTRNENLEASTLIGSLEISPTWPSVEVFWDLDSEVSYQSKRSDFH